MPKRPILILHTVWMDKYEGWEPEPNFYAGGFEWAAKNGWGHELFNFKPFDGTCYGQVEHSRKGQPKRIGISKLGATAGDEYVDGVLVVWTAPQKNREGRTIVGWYDNARVYALPQTLPGRLKRVHNGENIPFRVEAPAKNCHLLSRDDRISRIPGRKKGQKGYPGQSNIYYPHRQKKPIARKIEQAIHDLVGGRTPKSIFPPRKKHKYSADQKHREKVEKAAIDAVWSYYKDDHGYEIEDLQKYNVGYDLKATKVDIDLCIEVKGRSGPEVVADFSHNEFDKIKDFERDKFDDGTYRICMVTNALNKKPTLHHFDYVRPSGRKKRGYWHDPKTGIRIDRKILEAARFSKVD